MLSLEHIRYKRAIPLAKCQKHHIAFSDFFFIRGIDFQEEN